MQIYWVALQLQWLRSAPSLGNVCNPCRSTPLHVKKKLESEKEKLRFANPDSSRSRKQQQCNRFLLKGVLSGVSYVRKYIGGIFSVNTLPGT